MKTTIQVGIELDAEYLARDCDRAELHDLIVGIDEQMQDWDFTLKLCEHFEKLKAEYEEECAEDAKFKATP